MKRIIIEIPEDWDGYLGGNQYPRQYSYISHADPCENCPNNPKNNLNASGICSCMLPYMHDVRYDVFDEKIKGSATGNMFGAYYSTYTTDFK